ncbi:MAG: hybrid sensor histidine kinase/response regulator [Alphaproteobacteria bacterium]|nr:hybrid sensor histidine kinase/response regulator [Alphaproteobacteria bacterium]
MSDIFEFDETKSMKPVVTDWWKVLIIDDNKDVHAVTRLALKEFEFDGKGLKFISAYSGSEAKKAIAAHKDAAVMLLDVVMESDHAGLDVVRYVRESEGNDQIRIILRTGQPGQAPEATVIRDYDINDYKEKTDLTGLRLTTTMYASLRAFRDIVKLKTQGEALRQATRAAELGERAKSSFMATASHELRTPLNAIIGMSQMMHEEVFGPLGHDKYKEYIWDINTSGEQLLAMVKDLLDMADGSISAAPLRMEKFDLAEVVDDCLNDLKMMGRKGIEARARKRSDMVLDADRFAVRRMLLCLISNALKFATKPSNVEVSAQRRSDGALWLTIRDDGPGFGDADLDQLTRPFASIKDGDIATGSGLGIGLSIARQLIERHGGELVLENREGGGAITRLLFPAERAPV